MIESEVIDVRVGEPHVTAEQIADVNIGSYGPEDYVLSTGKQMAAELITNNSVRVFDGVMVYGGIRDAVPVNKYYDLSIDNGSQGKNRNDIIVRRFTKEEGTSGKGTSAFAVVKGTAVSGTASDPAIPVTDIRGGALNHDMLLHRVRLEGLNIIAVEPLYKVLYNADEIQEKLTELNGNMGGMKYKVYDIPPNTRSWSKGNNSAMVIDIDYAKIKSISAALYTATTLYALPIPAMSNEGAYNIAFAVSVRLSNSGTLTLSCGGEWSKYGLHVVVGYVD